MACLKQIFPDNQQSLEDQTAALIAFKAQDDINKRFKDDAEPIPSWDDLAMWGSCEKVSTEWKIVDEESTITIKGRSSRITSKRLNFRFPITAQHVERKV